MKIVAFCIYFQYVQGIYFNPHQPQYSEAVPFQAYFPSRTFEEQQFSPAFFPDELLELENELSKFDLDNGQRSVLQQQSLCGLIKPMCPVLKKSCSICKKFLSVKSCKKICQTSKKYCNSSLSCDGEPALEEITGGENPPETDTECYNKINPQKSKKCRDQTEIWNGICDGTVSDCESKARKRCYDDSTCFGITYPYKDMDNWLQTHKGVMKCGSAEINSTPENEGMNILMKCDPGAAICHEKGQCINSIIYGSEEANDYADCMAKCSILGECHFITYMPDQKYCLMFRTCPKVESTKGQINTGILSNDITSSTACSP